MQVNSSNRTNALYQVPMAASPLDPAGSGAIAADGKPVLPADNKNVRASAADNVAKPLDLNNLEVPPVLYVDNTRPATTGSSAPRPRPTPPPPPPRTT